MMQQERQPAFIRFIVMFISYIAILQVLYAVQSIIVSIPVVATVTTFYVLILKRTSSSSKSLKTILNYTGSNIKTNTTHERDLQNLIIQQTEEILHTNLQQFHKVIYSKKKKRKHQELFYFNRH